MNRSYLIALGLCVVVTGWMAAGYFTQKNQDKPTQSTNDKGAEQLMAVQVETSHAQQVNRYLTAQGQVESNRVVIIKAETAGRVTEIMATEGWPIKAGEPVVKLALSDREARLKKIEASLQEREKAYARAKQLGNQGHQAQRIVEEAYSALQSAQADMAEIKIDIANTQLRAPFDGILEQRHVEIGDYVTVNGDVATLVDNNPLVVAVQIAQQDIAAIKRGQLATVNFATGQTREGKIRFVAARADTETRTFRVEIEVANPEGALPSGTSATARLPTGFVTAHFISPALLTLSESGQIGIKTVAADHVVKFTVVEIVLAESAGVWVSGLPETVNIITVGQGFVRAGDPVRTVWDTPEATMSNLMNPSQEST